MNTSKKKAAQNRDNEIVISWEGLEEAAGAMGGDDRTALMSAIKG